MPYVFGIYPGEISIDTFVLEYSHILRVLPPILGHPVVPDVQHTLILLGVLLSCGFSLLAFRETGSKTQRSPRVNWVPGWSAVTRLIATLSA